MKTELKLIYIFFFLIGKEFEILTTFFNERNSNELVGFKVLFDSTVDATGSVCHFLSTQYLHKVHKQENCFLFKNSQNLQNYL